MMGGWRWAARLMITVISASFSIWCVSSTWWLTTWFDCPHSSRRDVCTPYPHMIYSHTWSQTHTWVTPTSDLTLHSTWNFGWYTRPLRGVWSSHFLTKYESTNRFMQQTLIDVLWCFSFAVGTITASTGTPGWRRKPWSCEEDKGRQEKKKLWKSVIVWKRKAGRVWKKARRGCVWRERAE